MYLLPHPHTMAYIFSWVLVYTSRDPAIRNFYIQFSILETQKELAEGQSNKSTDISDSKYLFKRNP